MMVVYNTKEADDQSNNIFQGTEQVFRHFIVRLFLLFSFAMLLSGCDRNETPTLANQDTLSTVPIGTKYLALERFETKSGVFELGMAPCTAAGCAFEVRWQAASKPILSIPMPVLAANHVTEKEVTDLAWGADANLRAWSTGIEEAYVSTVARPVSLGTGTVGLLITQRFGFDHLKRIHRLVAPRDGRLVFLWEFTEGPGYIWSAAVISPPSGITLFHVRYHYELSDPDSLKVTQLIWNTGKLVAAPQRVVATALVAGDFTSPNTAYAYRDKDAKRCFQGYIVLTSDSIKTIPKGRSALVQVFVRREEAKTEKNRLAQCGSSFNISVADVLSLPLLYQDKN